MRLLRFLNLLLLSVLLVGCKVVIKVPENGRVKSESGAWVCHAGETCMIEVTGTDFDELFVGIPESGYTFQKWRAGDGYFCGGRARPCRLVTKTFGGNPVLEGILASEREFILEPVFISTSAAEQHTVSASGGSYEFLNGVVLDIPPGAVDEPVSFTVTDLPAASVDSVLSYRSGEVSEKRYLGGFSVTPDFEFNIPITATFPVAALGSYETPMQIEVERPDQQYWFEKTVL